MQFMADGNQSIFGSNRNDVAGSERKYYSGRVRETARVGGSDRAGSRVNDLEVNSVATFESGQVT